MAARNRTTARKTKANHPRKSGKSDNRSPTEVAYEALAHINYELCCVVGPMARGAVALIPDTEDEDIASAKSLLINILQRVERLADSADTVALSLRKGDKPEAHPQNA